MSELCVDLRTYSDPAMNTAFGHGRPNPNGTFEERSGRQAPRRMSGGGGVRNSIDPSKSEMGVVRRQQDRRRQSFGKSNQNQTSREQPGKFALVREQGMGNIMYDSTNVKSKTRQKAAVIKKTGGWR